MASTQHIEGIAYETMRAVDANDYCPPMTTIDGPSTGPTVLIDGEEFVNFSSNSYLGIADHPRIKEAIINGLDKYGFGSGGSRMTCGNQRPHEELEEAIAHFKGAEAAILLSTGALANLGIIPALTAGPLATVIRHLDPEVAALYSQSVEIFCDNLNHATIIDGCVLAAAQSRRVTVTPYKHRNMQHLQKKLAASSAEIKLIITDGVFSLHGHLAPLDQITALASKYNAEVYVDDAHGTGILGPTGRGSAEHFGVEIGFNMGTFSKAFASEGGFLTGSKDMIRYLRVAARTALYQTSMAPHQACGLIETLKVVDQEGWRRSALTENADYLRRNLLHAGYFVTSTETQIVPILVGDVAIAQHANRELRKHGVFAPCYWYPSVKMGEAIIRVNVMATHTKDQLDKLVEAVSAVVPAGIQPNHKGHQLTSVTEVAA